MALNCISSSGISTPLTITNPIEPLPLFQNFHNPARLRSAPEKNFFHRLIHSGSFYQTVYRLYPAYPRKLHTQSTDLSTTSNQPHSINRISKGYSSFIHSQ